MKIIGSKVKDFNCYIKIRNVFSLSAVLVEYPVIQSVASEAQVRLLTLPNPDRYTSSPHPFFILESQTEVRSRLTGPDSEMRERTALQMAALPALRRLTPI